MTPMKDLPGLNLKKNLEGVGGFLGWIVAGLMIGTPVVNAAYLAINSLTERFIVVVIEATLALPIVVYAFVIGFRLWRVKAHALRQAKVFAIVIFTWSTVQIALFATTDQGVIRTTLWSVVLFIYFRVSKRVENTYATYGQRLLLAVGETFDTEAVSPSSTVVPWLP